MTLAGSEKMTLAAAEKMGSEKMTLAAAEKMSLAAAERMSLATLRTTIRTSRTTNGVASEYPTLPTTRVATTKPNQAPSSEKQSPVSKNCSTAAAALAGDDTKNGSWLGAEYGTNRVKTSYSLEKKKMRKCTFFFLGAGGSRWCGAVAERGRHSVARRGWWMQYRQYLESDQ
ncbi:hypothetical protein E2562_018964 [Oryza meyeriana var. granulata]|uniref:Uncharacterized protein n=1 Tax=Oryza meyeriana var. granulata TaxID=110450 RepID=A0A6G1DJX5_9ORYZ|nr:hypothetical protein E2562_018964 [Oryza meyeriana var. granulata]